ncbi:alpha,alpha-trehalose phosphate synthase subunit [Purpureocillium lavendulum]|uniref:Alpha,alpha-trehalose phosphate synthase subunit n=1 Tax=Purpureocillium lavendulum TaxID=1247861 RepID=A0AB34FBE1_9HYPO|nr:alpha,alpha-trehalose phosphate synthase subunit [Purpureocillium lavendulum]
MTVFVCSLVLPKTVHFGLPNVPPSRQVKSSCDNSQPDAPPPVTGKSDALGASIRHLSPEPADITPPHTPPNAGWPGSFSPGPFSNEDGFRMQLPSDSTVPNDDVDSKLDSRVKYLRPHVGSPLQAEIFEQRSQRNTNGEDHNAVLQRLPPQRGNTDGASAGTWTIVDARQGNGGLRNAVNAAVRDGKISHCTWIGTLGMRTDAVEGTQQKMDIEDALATEHDMLAVFCSDKDWEGHYPQFCKQILWPVFHYQMPDGPKSRAYEDHSWKYYVNLNQRFADKIVENWKRGDVIWVHDYHLLLVPRMVRKRLPDAKIGFYLHVPFPSSEIFRSLAFRQELLQGILGANLIGFQVQEYARHFLQTCSRLLSVESTTKGIQLDDRFVDVASLAIGIDSLIMNKYRGASEVIWWLRTLQSRYKDKRLIVGRDKLDHVRGVHQKLLSYELFLNENPEWRGKVVLIQIALSSSERTGLDRTVSDIVARINSSTANLAYQPVVYLKQDIDYAQYLALLSIADALVITSQREGMELTSHEYIICQDGRINPQQNYGPLILSEFTGTSSLFNGNELSVNPWSYRQCADAIKMALEMTKDEKKRRWEKLYEAVTRHTGADWFGELNTHLNRAYEEQHMRDQTSVPRLSIKKVLTQYGNANRRLILLGFEGTLVNWGPVNQIAPISPQRTITLLNELLMDDRNIVYVMSGRSPEELEGIIRMVPNLGVIAENGCFVRYYGSNGWTEMANSAHIEDWKKSVKQLMTYFLERTPGSEIEERHCSLHFHCRDVEGSDTAFRQVSACASQVNDVYESQNVHAVAVDHSVIVEPTDCNTAIAIEKAFNGLKARLSLGSDENMFDFVMVLGCGRHEEKVFKWANALQKCGKVRSTVTVSLGHRSTEAKTTLSRGVTGEFPDVSLYIKCED